MASCAACGRTVLFGGTKDGNFTYCNDDCYAAAVVYAVAADIPPEVVRERAMQIFGGLCPKCGSSGPVEIFSSHFIASFLVMTSFKTREHLCCVSCARKSQLMALFGSVVAGWWGFPWGILMTPVYVVKNVAALVKSPPGLEPSPALIEFVSTQLAAEAIGAHDGARELE